LRIRKSTEHSVHHHAAPAPIVLTSEAAPAHFTLLDWASESGFATFALTRHQTHMTETTILRKPLLKATLPKRQVTAVDVREITFQPNQQTGRHRHPCPVIGYIAEGSAVLQIEGQRPQQLPTGSAFYEPADVIITRFDNASATAPMKFIAQYLLDGDQPLIEML
jgi:quercetin dioxygenase-like cupin family protein